MHNAVMCTLSLYDVIRITRHLHIKLKLFSNIAQPLHKEAVRHCSFSLIIAKKSVIMSEAFLVDVSIYRLLHGVFYPRTDLSPSRPYQPEPEGRGLILSEGCDQCLDQKHCVIIFFFIYLCV